MPKDIFNQTSSSISSKPAGEAQGFATTTHADLNNDMVELYLSFLSPDEIAQIKRVSWGYYEGANQALNHYQLIDKEDQEKVGLKFLKLESSNRQSFLLVQNSQGQSQVYAWGDNRFDQLSLGHDNNVNRPGLLPFPDSLANWTLNNIVFRWRNFFVIFQNAEGQKQVYAWGTNEFGQLGLGHNNSIHIPTLIPFFKWATGPGQLPLQRRKILNSLTANSEAAFSSTGVSSNQSSRSSEWVNRISQVTAAWSTQSIHLTPLSSSSLNTGLMNSYLSSQSSLSHASSSLTAGSKQKCALQ